MSKNTLDPEKMKGVWSAAPTPLTNDMKVHKGDVKRMVGHHIRLGVNGLFLAGTNGEGPWLPELEKRIARFWEKEQILDKYLHKNDGAKERFSFLDGPITANNPMGVHHARGRSLKDLYQRYKNMQG